MREIFVNSDHARVGLFRAVLDEAGIATFIRNENANYITEMPAAMFYPALCVVNDEDYDEAMRLLRPIYYEKPSTVADWRCAKCGEEVPATFDTCWQCGELRGDLAVETGTDGSDTDA